MNNYNYRKTVIYVVIVMVALVYIVRLFCMQVLTDEYKIKADNNSQRAKTIYPARGMMLDRNGIIMVENQPAYDLLVTPNKVKPFDTVELTNILEIDVETFVKSFEKCKKFSRRRASVVVSQITADRYATLQEKLHKYPGFEVQTRTLRTYNLDHSADVFGYVGEISQAAIDKDTTNYYAAGDYVGITGLEKAYEEYLRGVKGVKYLVVDNFNQVKGSLADGAFDISAQMGQNITTTLDAELQEYAYKLMQNKRGGIIAIEPSSGEILLKVSSPGYDPELMIGLNRGKNYRMLQQDKSLPLFDRTLQSTYPPGSTFKTLQALVGLQLGVVTPESKFSCSMGAKIGPIPMRCHNHPSPLDLRGSIQNSCNPWYVHNWMRILESNQFNSVRDAYINWRSYIMQFGLGQKIAPEFSSASAGLIPSADFFDKRFRTQKWRWSYISSISIGQGEILVNPLQIANMACCIANKGHYITPHIVRAIGDSTLTYEKHDINIDKKHFNVVIDGMEQAITGGTAKGAAMDAVVVCGKTGTAQNPHGEDHSIFMVFAPRENPKIAMAIYIENGGFGSTYAVPIGGLILEKYLNGEISEQKRAVEQRIMSSSINYD